MEKKAGEFAQKKGGGVADLKEWGRILNLLHAVRIEKCVRGGEELAINNIVESEHASSLCLRSEELYQKTKKS